MTITFQVRAITTEDIANVAKLHIQVFPEYFLSHLGIRFLERYYGEFVNHSDAFGFIAIKEDDLVGFVTGVVDPKGFYKQFYRKNFLPISLILVGRLIVDPVIRRDTLQRIGHIRYALQSIVGNGKNTLQFNSASEVQARLLSIGVMAAIRGSGVAEKLVDSLGQRFRQADITRIGLSVRSENEGAIAFYEKTGWQRESANSDGVYYFRNVE